MEPIFAAVIRCLSISMLILSPILSMGQNTTTDTAKVQSLEEVVVTATRNERMLGALPMPVTLVSKAQIRTMGSLRLNDVLNEQTGLVSVPQVNGFGNGLQLQGFDPDYTLILVDGEPLIGRSTGSFDLGRITVGNIKQIEIVKGPSSSLYGSDALAGVVNIITERPSGTTAHLYSRYGTNNTLDASGDFALQQKRIGFSVFGNRFSTSGYDLSPLTYGKTVSPYQNYTFTSKLTYKIAPSTDFTISGRYYDEHQQSQYQVDNILSEGKGHVKDWNLNPVLIHRFGKQLKITTRFYTTRYQTNSELHNTSTGEAISSDDFLQTFVRPEVNGEYFFNDKNVTTAGTGFILESVRTNRYGDEKDRNQITRYGFIQHEWDPIQKVKVIAGGRYDHNSIYGGQLSPKFSFLYAISPKVTLKGSLGVGFKAPDFRQLYLNFTNAAAGGYSVFGTEVAIEKLTEMDAQGQIAAYLFDPALLGKLKAERSASFNLGTKVKFNDHLLLDVNFFRNTMKDLIETQLVAVTTSNQSIYSYRNLNHVFTEGIESNLSYTFLRRLTASIGYQLLYAMDQDKLAAIRRGEIFRRDPNTLESFRLTTSEYFGLYNRSRHMGNFKIFYENKERGLSASLRVIYRGRYGISSTFGSTQGSDTFNSGYNGNDVLDVYDQFVKGYALVNLSVGKTIIDKLRIQVGVDNLFNHIDPLAIPNLPGRLIYTSLGYTLSKKQP